MRPKTYLFPGTVNGWRADKTNHPQSNPGSGSGGSQTSGPNEKHVTPHTLRHSYATHLLEACADVRTSQMLLGQADLMHTTVYPYLSRKHLQAAPNPLDHI
jgi:integrase/recombinase XerD